MAAQDEPREWLASRDGRIVRVRTMDTLTDQPGEAVSELVPWNSPRAHPVLPPLCACGAPRLGGAQSCGSTACVARLWQAR
ncbi:MAG TPA: hypothetical protein VGA04_00565 [Streptosporangiaceae bacterium]